MGWALQEKAWDVGGRSVRLGLLFLLTHVLLLLLCVRCKMRGCDKVVVWCGDWGILNSLRFSGRGFLFYSLALRSSQVVHCILFIAALFVDVVVICLLLSFVNTK